MTVRFLNVEDLLKIEEEKRGTELSEVASEYAHMMRENEKVLVKEKTTARGNSLIFYRYNDKEYRYQPVGEFIL